MKEKIKAVGLAVTIVVTIIVSLVLHILSYIMDDLKVAYSRENLCLTKDDFQTKCFEEATGRKIEEIEHIVEGEEV